MRKLMAAVLLMSTAAPALAKDVNIQCSGCQAAFESMSQDLVATIDYKALGPAASTGVVSLGLGGVVSYVPVDKTSWNTVTGGNADVSAIGMAGLQVTKGLPFDIDIGAFYSTVPSTDIKLMGGELRYAILAGGVAEPALAVRASYVRLSGVSTFDADSKAVDVSLSKGFPFFTPYVGVGYVMGSVDPKVGGLTKADVNKAKGYVGLRLSMGLFEITPEVGKVGDDTTYALRAGFSFSL